MSFAAVFTAQDGEAADAKAGKGSQKAADFEAENDNERLEQKVTNQTADGKVEEGMVKPTGDENVEEKVVEPAGEEKVEQKVVEENVVEPAGEERVEEKVDEQTGRQRQDETAASAPKLQHCIAPRFAHVNDNVVRCVSKDSHQSPTLASMLENPRIPLTPRPVPATPAFATARKKAGQVAKYHGPSQKWLVKFSPKALATQL